MPPRLSAIRLAVAILGRGPPGGLGRRAPSRGVRTRRVRFTAPLAAPGGRTGVFERTGLLVGLPFSAGRIVLPGGGQRGAAEYPIGPVRGHSITYLPLGPI
jgi:hypothetical protein